MNLKSYIVLASLIIVTITASVASASADETATASMPQDLLIAKGTIIKVQTVDAISSQKNKRNEKVHFRVIEDITVGEVTVVPVNTDVEGVITKVKKAGPWGRSGQIEVVISEVKSKDGHLLPVSGMLRLYGDKPNILIKYSLVGGFIKGKEAVVKAGVEVNLQIKEDTKIASNKR
ncbi:MAG: hypothetical protein K0Q77_1511 [Anaerosporomusa subterranea]|jgi:hypothetical protein|nr:hypothetical protein [Anaerosporomusa subterranea]